MKKMEAEGESRAGSWKGVTQNEGGRSRREIRAGRPHRRRKAHRAGEYLFMYERNVEGQIVVGLIKD